MEARILPLIFVDPGPKPRIWLLEKNPRSKIGHAGKSAGRAVSSMGHFDLLGAEKAKRRSISTGYLTGSGIPRFFGGLWFEAAAPPLLRLDGFW